MGREARKERRLHAEPVPGTCRGGSSSSPPGSLRAQRRRLQARCASAVTASAIPVPTLPRSGIRCPPPRPTPDAAPPPCQPEPQPPAAPAARRGSRGRSPWRPSRRRWVGPPARPPARSGSPVVGAGRTGPGCPGSRGRVSGAGRRGRERHAPVPELGGPRRCGPSRAPARGCGSDTGRCERGFGGGDTGSGSRSVRARGSCRRA